MRPSDEELRAYTSPEAGSACVATMCCTRGLVTTPDQETCTSDPDLVTPTTARLGRISLEDNM